MLQWNGYLEISEYLKPVLLLAVGYRTLVSVIELKQGMSRIICLDVEEITARNSGTDKK